MSRFEFLYRQPLRIFSVDPMTSGGRFECCVEQLRSFDSSRRDMQRIFDITREDRR